MSIDRRRWLAGLSAGALCADVLRENAAAQEHVKPQPKPLDLSQYEPRSMLHVKETRVERARYPLIDIHTHLSFSSKVENGVSLAAGRRFLASPESLLPVMERRNIRALTNLTGGFGDGLAEAVQKFDKTHPGRFYTFTEPSYNRFLEPDYPRLQSQAIAEAHSAGAKGLKILKTLWFVSAREHHNRQAGKSGRRALRSYVGHVRPAWDSCCDPRIRPGRLFHAR
jgi:hypothetical protein